MTLSVNAVLPYPPSVNRYWRSVKGRAILSSEARAYRREVVSMFAARRFTGSNDIG